jgi:hypothetical protein
LSCAEDNISEHFWLFAAGEPLFPSKVWEKACSAISQHRHIPRRFFYEEARKPGTIGKKSWFPGFLMELILVAAPPRCALCG